MYFGWNELNDITMSAVLKSALFVYPDLPRSGFWMCYLNISDIDE